MISATCSVPSRSASFLGCVQDFQPVMKPSVQSCGLRQAEHSSCLRFLDHSDIFQTDTAVPEGLENWSSYITVLISMGYISLSSGWSKINWLFFFSAELKKIMWVDQKSECFKYWWSCCAVVRNSFSAVFNKIKTYFCEVMCYFMFYLFGVFHWMI